jgi:hypothetical protein
MIQALIVLSGAVAIWFVDHPNKKRRRLGSLVGLLGQPFWIYSTIEAAQWGMFALTLFYTAAWGRMFWRNLEWGNANG